MIPLFLQGEWRGAGPGGRAAWPAPTLMALMLLRWAEGGVPRLTACRRAKTDLAWRAAMNLGASGATPSEKTMREFEWWLMQRSPSCDVPRYHVVHQWLFEMVVKGEPSNERLWMEDSTPMFCFGALRGTVRLLGDGLRGLLRRWARATHTSLARLALDLGVAWVTAKSTKGGLGIDWRNAESRHDVVHRLATDVQRVVAHVMDRVLEIPIQHRRAVQRRCEVLLKVMVDDLETDAAGRLVVAIKTASDRIVSVTDPEARSGRKSRKQPFKGFKLNVLGDLLTGIVAAVRVVPGNAGDGGPGIELLERAKAMGLQLQRVLADTAYGGTPDRMAALALGVELVAPPPPLTRKKGDALRKHEFNVDFDAGRAICPAGESTSDHRLVTLKDGVHSRFEWPADRCAACRLRTRCMPTWRDVTGDTRRGRPRKGRRLTLDVHEQELRASRATWADPARRAEYRRRGEGELLIARVVRYGGRRALAFGIAAAELQAYAVAMAANLARLARTLAASQRRPPTEQSSLFRDDARAMAP